MILPIQKFPFFRVKGTEIISASHMIFISFFVLQKTSSAILFLLQMPIIYPKCYRDIKNRVQSIAIARVRCMCDTSHMDIRAQPTLNVNFDFWQGKRTLIES